MYNPLCCVSDPAVAAGEKSSVSALSYRTTTTLTDRPNNRFSPSHSPSPLSFRYQSSLSEHFNSFRSHSVATSPSNRRNYRRRIVRSLTSPAAQAEAEECASQLEAMTINDVVGNGVCGILYKWVNYGRGWRVRWFVLQDGVLSFYKLHGRDKFVINHEAAESGCKVIGEESFRRILSRRGSSVPAHQLAKPDGEIHLKIATIQESRSDDKKFSIFTGTKTLRLRADNREERATWITALSSVKDLYPRISKSESLKGQLDDMIISTEKLRLRLLQEGISEIVIQDCEQIMRNELSRLHNQLLVLKRKEMLLRDTLSHLETEKVDLENTVVDESQRLSRQEASSISLQANHDRGSSDPDNINENDAVEEGTEDDDNGYFDTRDALSCCSFKTSASEFWKSSFDSNDQSGVDIDDNVELHAKMMRSKHPCVKRRKKLPDPAEKEKGVNLWSMIKDNIGKDLTKVCLPVYFNEPLSSLQKCFEDMEYSDLIDRAYEWGKMGNSLMQTLNVAAFAISGYACTEGRTYKPFNPLLGETYEADFPEKGLRFISEKVSHHPMILACHCEGRGWKFWGDSNLKSKFWGRSIQLDPIGVLTLEFDDGEVFQWSKVTTSIYNLIIGKLYCDHYGTMRIQGCGEYSCKIKFKEQSIIDRNPHQVQGVVQNKNGKTVATLFGKWDESLHYIIGDQSEKGKVTDPLSEASLLWRRSEPPEFQTRYNLTKFAMTLNELTPGLKEKLPHTDSRLRPDQRHLENGEFEKANSEKLRLEQRQRQTRKMQERGWKPRWFEQDKDSGVYRYTGGYWAAREQGKWESCPKIFGDSHMES